MSGATRRRKVQVQTMDIEAQDDQEAKIAFVGSKDVGATVGPNEQNPNQDCFWRCLVEGWSDDIA